MTDRFHPTTLDRQRTMLRTAMGPAIATALTDPAVIEVMVNPDGRLWIDRHGDGRIDTGERLEASEAERIIRLIASHIGQECHRDRPVVSAELPETGERFEGLLPPVSPSPCFAIRKPARVLYRLSDYVDAQIMTPLQAKALREAVEAQKNIVVVGGTSSASRSWVGAPSCITWKNFGWKWSSYGFGRLIWMPPIRTSLPLPGMIETSVWSSSPPTSVYARPVVTPIRSSASV